MSIIKETLKIMSKYPGGYQTIYEMIYQESPMARKDNKGQVLRNTLSKMKKRGLLSNKNGLWEITKEGEDLLKERTHEIVKFPKKKNQKNIKKTMIVVFDIPEKKRIYRDWLRSELIDFGYELIQKSVWFGPALPKEFIKYLDEKKLLQYIKFFKATNSDII